MHCRWLTAVFSLPVLVFGLLLCSSLHVIPGLLHSDCEMTWMYAWPQYQKINLSRELQNAFPQYSLHLYRETRRQVEPTLDWTPLQLRGVPALFIPGNAGSHKQVRSSASIALQMHQKEFPHLLHFDFFTVNLNEQFSGLFGGVLERQTKFVAACIQYILSLYPSSPSSPTSVVIVAHSMGGVVAQALFSLEDFPSSLVHTIITLASPLAQPVVSLDYLQHGFYGSIRKLWSGGDGVATNITLVSIAGGESDIQVPPHLTLPPHTLTPHPLSIATNAVPRNWVPADHQAVVWCRRVQLAVVRALFLLQAPPTNQLSQDPQHRTDVFRHLLFTGWKVAMTPKHAHMNSDIWTLVKSTPHYQDRPLPSPPTITALPLPSSPSHNASLQLLVASNADAHHWLFACPPPPSTSDHPSHQLTNCTDLSPLGKILPPKEKVVKYVRLGREGELEGASHVVVVQKSVVGGGRKRVSGEEREILVMEWCKEREHHLELPLLGSTHYHYPPSSHCTLSMFPIPHLTEVWQAYSAVVTSCSGVRGGLLSPWYPHTPLLYDNGTGHLGLSLSLQAPAPDGSSPELLVWAPHNCSLTISLSPSPLSLVGKLLVLYYPLLLPWVTAVAISAPRRQLHMELIMVVILWGSTCWGIPPSSDWEPLTTQRLWTSWAPPLLHVTAHGLYQGLSGLLHLLTRLIHCVLSSRIRQISAAFLAAVFLPLSLLCGGLGLACVVGVYALMAANHKTHRVLSLLTCLLLLSLPSLLSWTKNLRYSIQLSPDPLFWPLLLSCTISLLLLLVATDNTSQATLCGPLSLPFSPHLDPSSLPHLLLSLSLLLYATKQAHRLLTFSLTSLSLTAITSIIYHQSPAQKKINNK